MVWNPVTPIRSRRAYAAAKGQFCWSTLTCQFQPRATFLLRGLSYMRELPRARADRPEQRIGDVDGGGGWLIQTWQSET
jgi:hypothetical protein